MLSVEAKEDIEPICPHCTSELRTLWMSEIRGIFGRRYIYFCPHCRKVLGVTHRKGLFMG
jgi:glutaredoxin